MKSSLLLTGWMALIMFGAGVVQADLTWLDREVEVKLGLGNDLAKAAFRFENRGETPVKIVDVRRSCGCTSVRIAGEMPTPHKFAGETPALQKYEKKDYAQGEKGKIEVEIKIGGQTGTVERSVYVRTSANEAPGQTLTVKAMVPIPFEVAPKQLDWVIGREIKAKQVLVTATEGMKIQPISVKCRHPVIEADYKIVDKGKTVQLTIYPNDTDGSLLSEVTLTLDVSSGKTTVKKEIAVPVKVDYDW